MKKIIPFLIALLLAGPIFAQKKNVWQAADLSTFSGRETIRSGAYSENQKFFTFDATLLQNTLANAAERFSGKDGVKISLPNISGNMEEFLVWENSNFEPELQAKYPEIRAYIGRGITDRNAKLYFSLSPQGIQTMILRADKGSEFIEPYTKDHAVYVLFDSETRLQNSLPLVCNTEETAVNKEINSAPSFARSNNGVYKTMRLALSCTGEYGTYHGGAIGALAAMNATMTRVNGVYDIDLAVHLNIIGNDNLIVYTNAANDPYSNAANMGNWNNELQANLTAVIGEANYDIGHLFGASGGGGDAGCIGCVCSNGSKGSGITSPGDNIPMGDNFDIDYVAHEMGHQLGGTHSYSHIYEGSGTNVEPASGSTIMGYAGVVPQPSLNVQAHSDDYFTYANIIQIQDNLAGKSCPVSVATTNTPPVVNAGPDYTIPKGTPFILTGSATDAQGDILDYTWEQNDDSSNSTSGNSSIASATKTTGPTFRSFSPTSSPTRFFPAFSRVINNTLSTSFESVSNVARTLNFTLTARDNSINGAQTNTDAMIVTVNATAGPFAVTAPNTNISWAPGSTQNVTWNVAGTTTNGVNAEFVDIYYSSNAGSTFATLLASQVPNDGSETITVPGTAGGANRIMVKGYNNVFYDISNTNFTVSAVQATQSIAFSGIAGEQNKTACATTDSVSYTLAYSALAGFNGTTTFSAVGNPAGSVVTFNPPTATASGTVIMTVSNLMASASGTYNIAVTSTSDAIVKTINTYLKKQEAFDPASLTSPANLATVQYTTLNLTWQTTLDATLYNVQLATDPNFVNLVLDTTTAATTYNVTGLLENTDYYWRVLPKNATCDGLYSATSKFTTGHIVCTNFSSANVPLAIGTSNNVTVNSTLVIPAASNVTIKDLNVTVNITHSWVSDMIVTLISPSGAQIQLISHQCDADPGLLNVNATFDNAGAAVTCGANPAISGTVVPFSSLDVLNNTASQGTWTLRVRDNVQGDGGSLNSWSLNICAVEAPLGIEDNSFFSFAVYPNPNNGSFTVQSDKLTSEKVKMSVYDMRGRIIFEKDYAGNANFNENIKLNNAQAGVYLLAVTDGQNKEVKRIVVQ
jgi:subtilisin-like proprotein convertase family protein